jgi:transcriptional regulator with XRE-family HTH domain
MRRQAGNWPIRARADHPAVATAERLRDRGFRVARRVVVQLGRDLRDARLALGLSQASVARAAGISRSVLSLIERGLAPNLTIAHAATLASILGLELSLKLYASEPVLRDAGHVRLLARFRRTVAASWRWRYEAALAVSGDARAWDAVLLGPVAVAVEAETHIHDVQAMLRRIALKMRDSSVDHVAVVVADTRHNRAVIAIAAEQMETALPCPRRRLFAALRQGVDPGASGLVLV